MSDTPDLLLFARARGNRDRTALRAGGHEFTYADLLDASARVAAGLLDGKPDLAEVRVAFLVPPGFDYAAVQWGIWRAGGVAVPLCLNHPRPELEYVVEDTAAKILIASPDLADRLEPIARDRVLRFATPVALRQHDPGDLPRLAPGRRAMILYTSGTTSRPKGVVTTHANIEAQVRALVEAWAWTADDRILLVLPLHHIHGIINVLTCALWSGARCDVLEKFSPDETWQRLASGGLSLFMAVPTIYRRLIDAWRAAPSDQEALSRGCRALRLMVSGSAALPVGTLETWREISGHTLLERYGMTEIGMALSNPLDGERRPGTVGQPLPRVEVRLLGEDAQPIPPNQPGEIHVRGPAVFREYWNRPEATSAAFRDDWFATGDMAIVDDGYYRILGRQSVDIIKTGGEKVSALEIEEVLRTHPAIAECAVVGISDDDWGQRVSAAVVLAPGGDLSLEQLRAWAKDHLAAYKVPRQLVLLDDLPRNAMGKVTKPRVADLCAAEPA